MPNKALLSDAVNRARERRVLQSVGNFLTKKLKLKVNESKSRVAKPRNRSLLGFSIGKEGRVYVSDKSIRRFKDRIRELTRRTRGRRIEQVVREIANYLQGWRQYYNYAYQKQRFRELMGWIKRRLRCYLWKQWGRAGYRELRKRGVPLSRLEHWFYILNNSELESVLTRIKISEVIL